VEYGQRAKPNTVAEFLERIIRINVENAKRGKPKHVPVIWGRHGIGKTAMPYWLLERGVVKDVVVVPLAQIEETGDIHGLPHKVRDPKDAERWITIMAPPKWVPTSEEAVVLVIDDFNRADPRIIRAIMQLLQFYETISWKLPRNTTIVLTGNPEGGPYTVTNVDPAMLTRMAHITMETDKLQWLEWAQRNEVDPRIMSFIAKNSEWLCPLDANARACPRAWADFSDVIRDVPTGNLKEEKELFLYGKAFLDDEVLAPFTLFLKGDLDRIVEPERIIYDYPSVRDKVLKSIRERRQDIVVATTDRLVAYVNSLKSLTEGSKEHQNLLAYLEEEELYKDLKSEAIRELSRGPAGGHLISLTLSIQVGQVVTV